MVGWRVVIPASQPPATPRQVTRFMIGACRQLGWKLPTSVFHKSSECGGSVELWVDWPEVAEIFEKPALGLELACNMAIEPVHQLTELAMTGRTLADGLRRILRYQVLVNPGVSRRFIDLQVGDSQATLSLAKVPWHRSIHEVEFSLSMLWRLGTWVIGERIALSAVHLMRRAFAEPSDDAALWGCVPTCEQPRNALVFATSYLERRSRHAELSLSEVVEASAFEKVTHLNSLDLVTKLRREVRNNLGKGPQLEAVARVLGVSRRTLQRRLTGRNTSFHAIVDEERRRWSLAQVVRPQLSIPEIADRSGFANTSGFYRAFKRWTGETPASFRARHLASSSESTAD